MEFKFNIGDEVLFNGNIHVVISRYVPSFSWNPGPCYNLNGVGFPILERKIKLLHPAHIIELIQYQPPINDLLQKAI